ncbi:hypothetical protein D1007_16048 [Hordeum vulgare]|nr:hypothetical protein D1007_16048 [Hordeum vulgare]
MAVEKLVEVNPPSDRVPGRGLLTLPISEALRWWNDGENCDSRKSASFSSWDSKCLVFGSSPNAVEMAEMNWKLKSSEEELDLLDKQFDNAQG